MEERLITVQTAKLAKDKGFDLSSPAYYGCDDPVRGKSNQLFMRDWIKWSELGREDTQEGTLIYYAPTQCSLQKWLRDVHDTHVEVTSHKFKIPQLSPIPRRFVVTINGVISCKGFTNYEDALEHGLKEALKQFNHEKRSSTF